jgi:branched-chain amino acid transport system permease protein
MVGQFIINGLLQGGFYACIGVTFSIVFGIMRIINLAQGTQIIVGAYITYAMTTALGVDPLLTLPVSMLVLFGLGYLMQKYIINLVAKGGLVLTSLLTFGLNLILINICLLIFKANYRGTTPPYMSKAFQLAGVTIPLVQLLIFVVAFVFTISLELFFRRTKLGNSIRATALNARAARLVGIDIGKTYCITFAISSALGGAMGTLFILGKPVDPFAGGNFLITLFSVAIMGGLGSIPGALLAGLILGTIESVSVLFLGVEFQRVVMYVVFILILMFMPKGLLGMQFYD